MRDSTARFLVIRIPSPCPATSILPMPTPFRPTRAASISTQRLITSSVTPLTRPVHRRNEAVNPFDRHNSSAHALFLVMQGKKSYPDHWLRLSPATLAPLLTGTSSRD